MFVFTAPYDGKRERNEKKHEFASPSERKISSDVVTYMYCSDVVNN